MSPSQKDLTELQKDNPKWGLGPLQTEYTVAQKNFSLFQNSKTWDA